MSWRSRSLAPLVVVVVVALGATAPAAAAAGDGPVPNPSPVADAAETEATTAGTSAGAPTDGLTGESNDTAPVETATVLVDDSSDRHDRETDHSVGEERNWSALIDVVSISNEEETDPADTAPVGADGISAVLTRASAAVVEGTSTEGSAPGGLRPVPFGVDDSSASEERRLTEPRSEQPAGNPSDGVPADGVALGAGAGALLLAGAVRQSSLSGLTVVRPASTAASVTADRLGRFLTAFRYSRYDDSDPLEHETRRAVYETIEDEPGTYLSAMSEATGIPLSTTRHHVRVLEQEELVVSAKVRGKRRFYPGEADEIAFAAAMTDDSTAAVLDALARLGPCSVAALADELGRDSSTVTHHLQRLSDDGLVERERDGRAVVNRLAAPARRVLEPGRAEQGIPGALPADD